MRIPYARIGSVAGGGVVALGLLEIALRALVSREPVPRPRILSDSFDAPVVTRRQIDEGVVSSHFSVTGARITGNPPLDSGATVVIIGDSFVTARGVPDEKTMGAELERIARAHGLPLDVRQYGWIGATPARYVLAAPEVLARWHPLRVVIPMASNDMDVTATEKEFPAIRVNASGDLRIVGPHADPPNGPPVPSAAWLLVRNRWAQLRERAPAWTRLPSSTGAIAAGVEGSGSLGGPLDSSELAALPGAVVRALVNAYGPGVVLVYLAEVGVTGGESPNPLETRFLEACRESHVTCVSTRADMVEARRHGVITRGATTFMPGGGHLNAGGHKVVATAMWGLLRLTPTSPNTRKHTGVDR